MYTQCPQCLTYFQVTPEHLRIAQGNVRCGQCRNVFSALGNLSEEPPKTAYQDNDDELEEEIFIDEDELAGYQEEYEEGYTEEIPEEEYTENFNEVYTDEYGEEYYIVEEEDDEQEPQHSTPASQSADAGKSATASAPHSEQHPNLNSKRPQLQSANINNKLSEAIATIERLKNSYSNLSIRNLEQSGTTVDKSALNENASDETKSETQTSERGFKEKPPAIAFIPEENVSEPPSKAEIFSPFIEEPMESHKIPPVNKAFSFPEKKTDKADVAIEHYPDDDGVNYEEALCALNDLKIIEEEDTLSEETDENIAPEETGLQEESGLVINEQVVAFHNDLSIDESELTREKLMLFENEDIRKQVLVDPVTEQNNGDNHTNVKIKSLDRKTGKKPRVARPADSKPKNESSAVYSDVAHNPQNESAAKYLPAIPKQLLEDFHPHHSQDAHHNRINSLWAVGSLMLMLVFLTQTVYFKHNDLARLSQLRPWIETFCGFMSCKLSLPSDVKKLELVSQDIRSHPKVKRALLVTTTIINNARFAQAYPGLQITFTDLNGQRIAMRRFAPDEYLSRDDVQAEGMPPNTPIQVELEMMDPGSNAVNFEFDFIPFRNL